MSDSRDHLERMAQHVAVEKEQRGQRLVLGGSTDVLLLGEVQQEALDRGLAQVARMLLVVEKDEAPDPSTVDLLGASTVVLEPQALPHGVEQPLRTSAS